MLDKRCSKILAFMLAGAVFVGWSGVAGAQAQSSTEQKRSDHSTMGSGQQSGQSQTGQMSPTSRSMMAPRLPQGTTPATLTDEDYKDLRNTIHSIAKNAMDKGNFNDVADYLTGPDRDRVRGGNVSTDDLDRTIDQFNASWKNKYNKDFVDADRDQVLSTLQFAAGQVTNPQQLAQGWPAGQSGQTPDQKGLQELQGRQIAVCQFPTTIPGAARVTVSMARNANNEWKFDIPDSIDGPTLKANLNKHLNTVSSMSDRWPSDANQAYEVVASHILAALYDTSGSGATSPSGQSGSSQQGSSSQQGGSSQY